MKKLILGVGLALVALSALTLSQESIREAWAQNIPCFKPQGGASFVAGVGCIFDGGGQVDVFVLDADNDTTISAPTDDQIDIEISGADDFTFTANSFEALTGSAIVSPTYDASGASAITIGSADVTIVTISTDDTGDGTDLVLPAQGVNGSEILNNTVTAVQTSNTLCLQIVSVEINPTEASATNDFINLVDNTFSTTETNENMFRVPVAAIVHNLAVLVDTAPGNGNDDWKITVRDDVADSTLTCTIDESATTCVDASNAPAVVALSKLAILVDSSGGDNDPDAAGAITVSFCLGQ